MEDPYFTRTGFARRKNSDYSVDSICLKCFYTAGSALIEGRSEEIESDHRCDTIRHRCDTIRNRYALLTALSNLLELQAEPASPAVIRSA